MYPSLKSYFLSIDKPPVALKKVFENDLSELYLWHLHSLVCIFHENVEKVERSKASIVEVMQCLTSVTDVLENRRHQKFVPLKVKSMLHRLRENGYSQKCDDFCLIS